MVNWEGKYEAKGFGVTTLDNVPKTGSPENVMVEITQIAKNTYKLKQTGLGVSGVEILQEGVGITEPNKSTLIISGYTPEKDFIWTFEPTKTSHDKVKKWNSTKIRIPGEVYYFEGKAI